MQNEELLVQVAMTSLIGPNALMSIFMLINMLGKEEHWQIISDESLLDNMIQAEDIDSDEVVPEATVEQPSFEDCLRAILVVKRYALVWGRLPSSIHGCLHALQRSLREDA